VLSGHSHSYERTFLLNGHYGPSSTLTAAHKVNAGTGDPSGPGGPYLKPWGVTPNAGTVYLVCGSSGQVSSMVGTHPAMVRSTPTLGSVVIDTSADTMDVTFLTSTGAVGDHFQVKKVVGYVVQSATVTPTWTSTPVVGLSATPAASAAPPSTPSSSTPASVTPSSTVQPSTTATPTPSPSPAPSPTDTTSEGIPWGSLWRCRVDSPDG
jgi:hypothetical protein